MFDDGEAAGFQSFVESFEISYQVRDSAFGNSLDRREESQNENVSISCHRSKRFPSHFHQLGPKKGPSGQKVIPSLTIFFQGILKRLFWQLLLYGYKWWSSRTLDVIQSQMPLLSLHPAPEWVNDSRYSRTISDLTALLCDRAYSDEEANWLSLLIVHRRIHFYPR